MPQILLPVSDADTTGWTTTPLWSKLDDHYPGGSDRVSSSTNPSDVTFTVLLPSGSDPGTDRGWRVRARLRNSAASTVCDYVIELRSGGVVRAQATFQHNNTTDTWYSFLLSQAEAASVNRADMSIQVRATKISGGNMRAEVEALQLEIPDAGGIASSRPGSVAQSKFRLWWEGRRLGLANGAAVVGVQDASGQANSLRTSIGSPTFKTNALNTHGAVVFDGTDDQMRMKWDSGAERVTIFAVMKLLRLPTNGAEDFAIWSGEDSAGKIMLGLTFGQGGLPGAEHVIEQAGIGNHEYFSCPTDGNYHLWRMRYDVLERCFIDRVEIVDGTMPADAGSNASIGMKLGSREDNARFANFEIVAQAVCIGLTDGEELAVQDYFWSEFLLIGALPAAVPLTVALPTPTITIGAAATVLPTTIAIRNALPTPSPFAGQVITGSFPSGFTVPFGETWEIQGVVTVGTAGAHANVVVNGVLKMRGSGNVASPTTLRFLGINETTFVGGGLAVLSTDPGLWVMDQGRLDIQGTFKTGWTRDPGSAVGWIASDEMWITPTDPGDENARVWALGDPVPRAYPAVPKAEVFNLSRDVLIEGQPGARAHIFIFTSGQPSTIKHCALRYLGPRSAALDDVILGRWPIHFHHGFDTHRGSLVEGVTARDCGSHVYVGHNSHGITFRDCISFRNMTPPFWWDDQQQSDDQIWDHCLAVETETATNFVAFNAGFEFGFGFGNQAIDCCAAATRGGSSTGGFKWTKQGANPDGFVPPQSGTWDFIDCVGHNQKNGVSWWQNTPTGHENTRFVGYNHRLANDGRGAFIGAYNNRVHFTDIVLRGNAFDQHAGADDGDGTGPDTRQGITGGSIEASPHSIILSGSNLPNEEPTLFKEVTLSTGVDVAVNDRFRSFDFVRCLVGANDLEFADFLRRSGDNYIIRVQRRDGTAFSFTQATGPTVIPAFDPPPPAGSNPAAVLVAVGIPTPTIVTAGSTTVFPATVAVVAAFPAPLAFGALRVSPATIALRASLNEPGRGASPQPAVVLIAVALPTPGIVIQGGATVQPGTLNVEGRVRSVSIIIGGSGVGAGLPDSAVMAAGFPTPSILAGARVLPATIALSAIFPWDSGAATPATIALRVAVAEPADISWSEPVDASGTTVQIDPI